MTSHIWAFSAPKLSDPIIPTSGFFAAGDFVAYDNKVELIAGTFTSSILALNSAKQYMDPDGPIMAYVSSHNERFKEKNLALGVIEEEA
ncbi:UNVERIFIED_CONTAM: hypothetical protein ABIC26_002951 [Paenibacillus sp. PvR008]